jgi:hypothetical protein
MKQKMSIVIDAEIVRLAKQRAAEEGWTLSCLIQEALAKHLRKGAATRRERRMAYHLFCQRPMKIPPRQLRYILKDDV